MSTIRLERPMSIFWKFNPDLASFRMRLKSGSSACCVAMAFQSTPREVMALITQPRSSTAFWRRVAASLGAVEGVVSAAALRGADERVVDAAASTGADESVDGGDKAQGGIVADPGRSGIGVPAWPRALTSASSSLGRESASATTLALP